MDGFGRNCRSAAHTRSPSVPSSDSVCKGADMGYAFLKHLVGSEIAETARGIVELVVHEQDDDEFAAFYKLT